MKKLSNLLGNKINTVGQMKTNETDLLELAERVRSGNITEEDKQRFNIETTKALRAQGNWDVAEIIAKIHRKDTRKSVIGAMKETRSQQQLDYREKYKKHGFYPKNNPVKKKMTIKRRRWTEVELELLEKYYPLLITSELLLLFPGFTRSQLVSKANRMRLLKKQSTRERFRKERFK